jgi:hypothetical protein
MVIATNYDKHLVHLDLARSPLPISAHLLEPPTGANAVVGAPLKLGRQRSSAGGALPATRPGAQEFL